MKKIINNKKFLLISLFICFSLFLCTFIFKESDYFWHIKAGEYMTNHGILTKDVFSYSVLGKYWMSHEWLFEVIIYNLKRIFGNYNMIVCTFISMIIIYYFFYKYNKDKIYKNLFFSLIWILLSSIFIFYMQCRPHLCSYIMLSISMYLIYSLIRDEKSNKIYFLPILTILWSNLHGGSSNLGYLLCFFVLIIGLFNFKFNKIEAKRLSKKQIKKLLYVGLISIFCTMINPHGFKMMIYPYTNMLDNTMISSIAEWKPTNINNLSHFPFFILAIIILLILLFSKKKISFLDFALFGLGIYLGLKAIRFWPYLYIISSYYIFDYVDEFKFNNIKYIILFINILIICLFIRSINKINNEVNKEYLYLDEKFINILKREKPTKLFNIYDTGGELIYHSIPVFIDGRADLYSSNGILNKYLNINDTDKDYEELIKLYDFDYYIVESGSRLEKYILNIGVDKLYSNDKYSLYKIK